MRVTFVGSFDKHNLKNISIITSILHELVFTDERSLELKTATLQFNGFSAKILLNDKNMTSKVTFRKDPIIKEQGEEKWEDI